MKEYWTVRARGVGKNDWWWIGDDFFLRQTKPEAKKFKDRGDAYEGIVKLVRSYAYYEPKSLVTFRLVHHTVKPRSSKPGTWAWACEQMLAGKKVTRNEFRYQLRVFKLSRHEGDLKICSRHISSGLWEPDSPHNSDLSATSWQAVS